MIVATILVGLNWLPVVFLSVSYAFAAGFALIALIWDARKLMPGVVRMTLRRIWVVLRPFLVNYWPLLILAFVSQSRIFIDKRIVSDLGVGAVAALWYARFIINTPAQTAGLAMIRMVLPRFSEMVELKKTDEIGNEILAMLETTMWVLLPGVALLAAAAHPLVDVLFGYKAFDTSAINQTSLALLGAAPALWTSVVFPLINRVFNAQGRNKSLLGVVIAGTTGNIVLAYFLTRWIGIAGVGLAQGIAQFAMILYLIPLIPGKITLRATIKMAQWWTLAVGLYLILKLLPLPENPFLSLGLVIFVALNTRRVLRVIKRLRKRK
jgi:putative peptidoglycan lipid II flippase